MHWTVQCTGPWNAPDHAMHWTAPNHAVHPRWNALDVQCTGPWKALNRTSLCEKMPHDWNFRSDDSAARPVLEVEPDAV